MMRKVKVERLCECVGCAGKGLEQLSYKEDTVDRLCVIKIDKGETESDDKEEM